MSGVRGWSLMARLAVGGLLAAVLLAPSTALAQEGSFQCRASAIRAPVIGEPQVANDQYSPCVGERTGVINNAGFSNQGGLTVLASVLAAESFDTLPLPSGEPTPAGAGWASVAEVTINAFDAIRIQAYGISANGGRKCLNGQPDTGGFSAIAYLNINGTAIPIGTNPVTIPLGGLGTLHLNQRQINDGQVLTRALFLDRPGGDTDDIVIAEARGGSTGGNPC